MLRREASDIAAGFALILTIITIWAWAFIVADWRNNREATLCFTSRHDHACIVVPDKPETLRGTK